MLVALGLTLSAIVASAFAAHPPPRQARLSPAAGVILNSNVTLAPGDHRLGSADLAHPALIVRGSNVTIDFSGATLRGADPAADPDSFTGVAVLVDGGEHVTIRNLTARGYKVGVLVRRSPGVHITGGDLGYNWKSQLYSLVEHESLVDWLSYHHNEQDEWLGGGAGIYLADSDGAEIDHTTVVQGQNGLMLARSSGAKVWNNTFSFLSGIGIGLYRASANTIMHNRIDWCVRGYSHTFYNRGQDSAGILIYEQSNHNVVAFNSVTHDGDGLFLWAGQSTMDTGQGGANDNVVFDNDFSFAPTNGIEATFSRNVLYGNRVEDCWHGLWGGYSFDSWIAANHFARNVEAIAIEHGQDNRITENVFDGDETAVHLWKNATQDPSWEYPKRRDTRSRDYVISGNTFRGNSVALKIAETQNLRILTNAFERVGSIAVLSGDTRNLGIGDEVSVPVRPRPTLDVTLPKGMPGGMDPKVPDDQRRGRDAIIVDEWGPYDWKSPKLWPSGRSDTTPLKLRVVGPVGEWQLASVRGAEIEPRAGRIPGEVTVTPARRSNGGGDASTRSLEPIDFDVRLTYRGGAVTSPRGDRVLAGSSYTFGYTRWFMPIDWRVRYYAFDEQSTPDAHPQEFARVLAGPPLREEPRDRLDFMSGQSIADGVPADRVAIVAEGTVDLPPGNYELRTISDDGLRVWVDDDRVIDHWTSHESAVDAAPIAAGRRRLKIEYFELGGFAELRVEIRRR